MFVRCILLQMTSTSTHPSLNKLVVSISNLCLFFQSLLGETRLFIPDNYFTHKAHFLFFDSVLWCQLLKTRLLYR